MHRKKMTHGHHQALGHLSHVTHAGAHELRSHGMPHAAEAISAHGGAIASIASVIHPMRSGGGRKGKKHRTAAQKRATAKMLAANRRARGGGRKKSAHRGGGKKHRTAKQKAATRKMIAANRRRRGKKR